jgi:hypothetical protein
VAGLLSAEYGFAEITLLRNAKQREIVRAFNRLAQTAQENDSVLIYYAGHGHLNEGTKEGFWIPVDAEGRDDSTFVPNATIKTKLGVTDALLTVLQPHADLVHTLTYDNGKEFAYHQTVAKGLDAQGYFAHPYHSWERGLNENTNGLIRQYLPKGTDFRTLTLEKVRSIMDRLNNRPRKCLGFKTPNQLFSEINPPVALTS